MKLGLSNRRSASDVFEQVADGAEDSDIELSGSAADSGVSADDGADTDGPMNAPDSAPNRDPARRRPRRRIAQAVAAAVFVAALGATAFLGWQYQQHVEVSNASTAALETAKNYAVTLTSIDSKGIDANFTQVLDGATGEFKDTYSQSSGQLRQALLDNKAMSKGMVVDAAVKSATRDKVEVLLFIDQSITNVANPKPRLDRSRLDMTMEHTDGRWLASSVELK